MTRTLLGWSAWSIMMLACLYYASLAAPYLFAPAGELRLPPSSPLDEVALRLHAGGGLFALLLGPLQFIGAVRRRAPFVHKTIGYSYVVCVATGVAGAAMLAQTPTGASANVFAFNMLAIIWALSTAMAVVNARNKRWREHQMWMIRSFALTFAAVSLRAGMPVLGWLGFAPSDFYTIAAWASWTINLIVAEWFIAPWLLRQGAAHHAAAMPGAPRS